MVYFGNGISTEDKSYKNNSIEKIMMHCYDLDGNVRCSTSLHNRTMQYGDGFFTTMRIWQNNIQLWHYHQQRLQASASALAMTLELEKITVQAHKLAQTLNNGIIKIHISRLPILARGYGASSADNDPAEVLFFVQATPISNQKDIPLQNDTHIYCNSMMLSAVNPLLIGLKTCGRLEQVLASKQLKKLQIQQPDLAVTESLLFDAHACLIEAISSNVFYQLDKDINWYTPSLHSTGIAGTMRASIVAHTSIIVRDIYSVDVPKITALFLTNAVKGITPVATLYDEQGTGKKLLNTQNVHSFYQKLCDNSSFIAHFL